MRAVWFAGGIVLVLVLGIWLFIPPAGPAKTTNTHPATNTNTTTTSSAVTVDQAVSAPQRYHGTSLCLTGYYQQSFEFSATASQADMLTFTLKDPKVWVDLNVPTGSLDCQPGPANTKNCFGQLTLCGVFSFSPAGGLGHLGRYRYQLGAKVVQPAANSNVPTSP